MKLIVDTMEAIYIIFNFLVLRGRLWIGKKKHCIFNDFSLNSFQLSISFVDEGEAAAGAACSHTDPDGAGHTDSHTYKCTSTTRTLTMASSSSRRSRRRLH